MPRHQHRTVVKREHPIYSPLRRVLLGALALVALVSAFGAGRYYTIHQPVPIRTVEDELRRQVVALETQLALESDTVINLHRELTQLRAQFDELERELVFYRDVMAPEQASEPIVLAPPRFVPAALPGQWRYTLVVQQGKPNKSRYQGDLLVTFWGTTSGVPASYTLGELDGDRAPGPLVLDFRYFQRIEGSVTLPPEFLPERVELQASISRPKAATVNREHRWMPPVKPSLDSEADST